jgi:hypothetical protein
MKNKIIETVSWIGTFVLMLGPYLMHNVSGFILALIGVVLITPPCIEKKQWNLVLLNMSSVIGYSIQISNQL